MPRCAQEAPSPWIESLIRSYGGPEESSSAGLRAYVIGVGHMSQSQARGSGGPTGLLFLSDGVLQMPAILTASAWEHLREQEDRECFTSLVNTTVCIQDYQLQFHMAPEQTRCRFILSVGELATIAVGPVQDSTPCSTTLPSIRLKICETWRALLGQETQESQMSQCGLDLSELLGEWQHDCLQAVLEDVRERLRVPSPQPSTSRCNPSLTRPDTLTATSWSVDRVQYKGLKPFNVPIKCLLIPEGDAQQLQTPPDAGRRTRSGLSETTWPPVDDAEWRIAKPAVVERDGHSNEDSPCPTEDSVLHEGIMAALIDSDIRPLSNPWDIFPPPCDTSSSSDASPEATPARSPHNPTEFKCDRSVILTSTQLPVHSSTESHQTSEHSRGEHSYLPPYQKELHSTGSSASESPPEPVSRPEEHHADTTQPQNVSALDQERQILEKDTVERTYRKRKRPVEEDEEETEISGSPPSWLFDSQSGSKSEEGCSHQPGPAVGLVSGKRPTAHSDGRPFSYSYQVSGQNLQDFSCFKVAASLLHWAVKYLVVPKQTDNPHNTSITSNQTSSDRTNITSL